MTKLSGGETAAAIVVPLLVVGLVVTILTLVVVSRTSTTSSFSSPSSSGAAAVARRAAASPNQRFTRMPTEYSCPRLQTGQQYPRANAYNSESGWHTYKSRSEAERACEEAGSRCVGYIDNGDGSYEPVGCKEPMRCLPSYGGGPKSSYYAKNSLHNPVIPT